MDALELKLEDVRAELETLIRENPDRYGTITGENPNEDDNTTCVYFEDAYPEEMTVPVCIVGTWINRFHPEFKYNQRIRSELMSNVSVTSWNNIEPVLPEDVAELLLTAQMQQDIGKQWGNINLDMCSETARYGG